MCCFKGAGVSDKQCLGVYKIIYKQIPSKSCLGLIPAGRVRSTRPAGTKIALHSRICVCVCVCVFVHNYHVG